MPKLNVNILWLQCDMSTGLFFSLFPSWSFNQALFECRSFSTSSSFLFLFSCLKKYMLAFKRVVFSLVHMLRNCTTTILCSGHLPEKIYLGYICEIFDIVTFKPKGQFNCYLKHTCNTYHSPCDCWSSAYELSVLRDICRLWNTFLLPVCLSLQPYGCRLNIYLCSILKC